VLKKRNNQARSFEEDEAYLVREAQKGNSQAFGLLYERYADRIYRYMCLRLGDPVEAEDLTAEVFLRALESLGSFRWRGAPFGAWLFRLAHNIAVDYWRKSRRQFPLPSEVSHAVPNRNGDVEKVLERKMLLREIQEAMKYLTPLQQQVITLRFAAGLSIAETAQVMGKKEGAVKNLQHKALKALRKLLAKPTRA